MPCYRYGKLIRYKRSEVEHWLSSRRVR
jgi:hypothetical protein